MREWFSQLAWPALAGVLAAVLLLNTEWLKLPTSTQGADSYSHAVAVATPSVVNIYTAKLVADQSPVLNAPLLRRFTNPGERQPRVERSLGSGVIMSEDGHIITNRHVIDGAQAIQILLSDGRRANAMVVGADPETDLALLKTDLTGLSAIETADSDNISVGDVVLAIGNPFGFGHSASLGIVSGLERYGLQLSAFENYIQTDASINQGNSGGALIDTNGRLIGINTLIRSSTGGSEGIGLAIPSTSALEIVSDLIQYGEVRRGWLGFSIDRQSLLLKGQIVIDQVAKNGPAAKGGLLKNDILISIDNNKASYENLYKTFARSKPGDDIFLEIERNNQILELAFTTERIN